MKDIKSVQDNLARMEKELSSEAAKNIIRGWEETMMEFQIGFVAGLYPVDTKVPKDDKPTRS
jgi:hypothetical protein